jgi:protocatechuate 3,4-dioxygenase beta subunit
MKKFTCIIVCAAWLLPLSIITATCTSRETLTQTSHDGPRFTPPPGAETSEIKNLIDKAQAAIVGGAISSTLLADPEYMAAHEWPRFRKLIRDNAKSNQLTIVTKQESGEPLFVSGTIRNKAGESIKGALVYVYQTSGKGWYSDRAPHYSGNSGDEKHARLFGYLTTNQDGQYELRTIRPVGYPNSNLPAHIHIEIEAVGDEAPTFISEILFADDPRLTSEARERSLREGLVVFPVTRTNGEWRVQADFQIH